MQDQSVPVTASEDGSSVSQPQVTPPFPSHPIWGAAHPPIVAGYGPYTKIGTDVLYDSLPCNKPFSSDSNDSNSDLDNLHYTATSFNTSTNSSKGSAHVVSGDKSPNIYGPDRWNKNLRGQASRGGVDALGPVTDEEHSMEVSDADTDRLLALADDEESEITLSPSSSSPSSVSGINPVVPLPDFPHRPIVSHPPIPSVCARPRLPTAPANCLSLPSPLLCRPTRPPFPSELPRPALPLTRATAPRLPRPFTPVCTPSPSELPRPALPPMATTPRPVQPLMSVQTRPFSTPRPKSFRCRPFMYKSKPKSKQARPPPLPISCHQRLLSFLLLNLVINHQWLLGPPLLFMLHCHQRLLGPLPRHLPTCQQLPHPHPPSDAISGS